MAKKTKTDEAEELTPAETKENIAAGVATTEQNAKLEHTEGGVTTRDDANDLGVPMLPGDPSEPQGPEDALGPGPKRGDYSQRLGPGYHPHEGSVPQRPRVEDVGDESGKKGGVETGES